MVGDGWRGPRHFLSRGLRQLLTRGLLAVILLSPLSCDSSPSSSSDFGERTLLVLYTNDETGDYLVLSGGDNWTGPAISTSPWTA
jgi:hypothetical protein